MAASASALALAAAAVCVALLAAMPSEAAGGKEPRYNEYCEKDHDCEILTENSICENNKCRCNNFTAMDDNKCKKIIDQLGVHCVKETEVCYLERDGNNQKVECKDQICTCKKDVNPSKDYMSCGGTSLEVLSLAASFIILLLAKILA